MIRASRNLSVILNRRFGVQSGIRPKPRLEPKP